MKDQLEIDVMRDDQTMAPTGAAAPAPGLDAHLRAFQAHWAEARHGAEVPYRSQIDPRRIAPLLADAFVAERIAPGVTRLRIAGMHLGDLMGIEARGMPLCSFIAPESRAAFALHLVDLFDRPATLRMDLLSAAGRGQPGLRGTLIMLPLRSDLGDVSRALGCLVTHRHAEGDTGRNRGRTPRRFEILDTRMMPVDAAPDTGLLQVVARGRGHGPSARSDRPATRSGRPHLRLVT